MEGKDGELVVGNTRFALLYNVQGLKYTLGKQFECRECQGEFIFCTGKSVSKTSHCRITCEAGGLFWVKDLQGITGKGTFINGERIGKRVELKFGDFLSLGKPGVGNLTNINLNPKDRSTFLFRAVNEVDSGSQNQDEEEDASQGESQENDVNVIKMFGQTPLRNSLVLSKIFGYLPSLSDVKNCRLVCSEWKEEATKLLKSNAITAFNYPNGYSSWTVRSRLFSFVQEMGGFFTQGRFCVILGGNSDRRGDPGHKMLSDLTWFFDPDEGFRHPITKLSLKGTLCSMSGRNLFLTVLQGASLTLEDLELDMELDLMEDVIPNVLEPFGINFPVLKKLSISITSKNNRPRYGSGCSCCGCSDSDDDEDFLHSDKMRIKMKKWMNSIMTTAPTLQSLKLSSVDYFCHCFAQSFLNTIISHKKGFPNLNSLNLYSYNVFVLKELLKLPNILESLTLGVQHPDFAWDEGPDGVEMWTVVMGKMLQKSAASLKYLELTLPNVLDDCEREMICLPVFPKLKVFKLKGFHENCVLLDDIGTTTFGGNFPVLNNFAVSGDNLREEDFFDVFFEEERDSDGDESEDGEEKEDDDDKENGKEENDKNPTSDDEDCDSDDDGKSSSLKRKEQIIKTVTFLEIENLENWSRKSMDKIDKLFTNAFNNKVLEDLRAKALIVSQKKWKQWWQDRGGIPKKIKKTE